MSFPVMPFMGKVDEAAKFKYTNLVAALETLTVPAAGTNDFMIEWGDGSALEHVTTASPTHEYILAGSYQISISGSMSAFSFGGSVTGRTNVTSFDQFGSTGLSVVNGFANGCTNCTLIDGSDFKTTGITNFSSFAQSCTSLTTILCGSWDMSSVTTLAGFIRFDALLTTIDVSGWDTGAVTTIGTMAQGCTILTVFDVSSWNTSSMDNIFGAFLQARAIITLNTDSWDTRLITNCSRAFESMDDLTSSFDEYRWWNRTDDLTSGGVSDPIATFSDCFKNAFNISNYASIPNNWKGL